MIEGVAYGVEPATEAVLRAHARIPIAFEVRTRLRVEPDGLVEEPVDPPWTKCYDEAGEHPVDWARRWDLARWAVLTARRGGARVAGAVLARDTDGVDMLEGRSDLAVLFDLRVHPDVRRCGLGRALVLRAAAWARDHGCSVLRVETQDINVPACRLYADLGFELEAVRPGAYAPSLPDETQILWRRHLRDPG